MPVGKSTTSSIDCWICPRCRDSICRRSCGSKKSAAIRPAYHAAGARAALLHGDRLQGDVLFDYSAPRCGPPARSGPSCSGRSAVASCGTRSARSSVGSSSSNRDFAACSIPAAPDATSKFRPARSARPCGQLPPKAGKFTPTARKSASPPTCSSASDRTSTGSSCTPTSISRDARSGCPTFWRRSPAATRPSGSTTVRSASCPSNGSNGFRSWRAWPPPKRTTFATR